MSREIHVRFCEGLGVRFPRATRHAAVLNSASVCPASAVKCNLGDEWVIAWRILIGARILPVATPKIDGLMLCWLPLYAQ